MGFVFGMFLGLANRAEINSLEQVVTPSSNTEPGLMVSSVVSDNICLVLRLHSGNFLPTFLVACRSPTGY